LKVDVDVWGEFLVFDCLVDTVGNSWNIVAYAELTEKERIVRVKKRDFKSVKM
jgi:hypothetical protein